LMWITFSTRSLSRRSRSRFFSPRCSLAIRTSAPPRGRPRRRPSPGRGTCSRRGPRRPPRFPSRSPSLRAACRLAKVEGPKVDFFPMECHFRYFLSLPTISGH
jgi:hypothetical protein